MFTVAWIRGGSRIFSRGGGGGGGFSKTFNDLFFLGRPNRFFELSQSIVLPLLWENYLRRRQNFEKTVKKSRFLALFEKNLTKNRVWVGRLKMNFLKIIKGGTLLVGRGSNSWEKGRPPPPKSAPGLVILSRIFLLWSWLKG